MKRYLICFLIIILCFSCLIPTVFAETKISAIQSDGSVISSYPQQGPVVIILDTNGHVKEHIVYNNTPVYYEQEIPAVTDTTNNTNDDTITTPEVSNKIENELAEQLFNLTNEERKKAGLNELKYNFELQDAADLRAKESATLFDHTRPNGETCYTAFNVDYNVAGENLIKADTTIATAENLMTSWMESSGHRANILLPEFTSVAIGIYEKDNVIYASQLFVD